MISKHRVFKNLIIMVFGQMITWLISIAHLVLVSRYLGPLGLGEFVLASAITTVLGMLVGLGMDTYITRAVARTPERGGAIVSSALIARGSLASLIPAAVLLYGRLAHLNRETVIVAVILGFGTIMQQFSGVFVAAFQGHEQMSLGAIGNVVFNACQLALTILAVTLNTGIVAFAANNALLAFAILLLNIRWARRYVRLTRHISLRDVRTVVRGSFAFSAGNLFQTFYSSIDSVILGLLAGNRPVAFYGSASRLLSIPMVMPQILGQVTLPGLSRMGIQGGVEFDRVARKTLSLLVTASIPLTVGVATFAGLGINLIFGPSFEPAVPVLVALSLTVPFTFIDMQFYQILAAENREMRWTAIMGFSCIINPIANLILIPLSIHLGHNGAVGAALALLVTEALMAVYGSIVLRRIVLHPAVLRSTLGAIAAGGIQAVALWVIGPQPLIPMVLAETLGGTLYLGGAIVLGAVPRQDVLFLWHTALRRPHPVAA